MRCALSGTCDALFVWSFRYHEWSELNHQKTAIEQFSMTKQPSTDGVFGQGYPAQKSQKSP